MFFSKTELFRVIHKPASYTEISGMVEVVLCSARDSQNDQANGLDSLCGLHSLWAVLAGLNEQRKVNLRLPTFLHLTLLHLS